jgi:hypothetical protein
MNQSSLISTLIVFAMVLVIGATGYYVTDVQKASKLQRLEEQQEYARVQRANFERLYSQSDKIESSAEEAVRKWRARYKYIPARMEVADIVQYLENLTRSGFEGFNIRLEGITNRSDFKYYTFAVSGTAYYTNLYDFIWHIENNREYYQVRDVAINYAAVYKANPGTGVRRRLDMVGFSFKLDAFFAGVEGLSAEPDSLRPVPRQLLPAHAAAHDSFFPVVRTDLPPNDQMLPDVQGATLISILGTQAIIQDRVGQHVLREGDAVYLGSVTRIDPFNSTLRATLNKGGVTEVIELKMKVDEPYRPTPGVQRLPLNQ